MHEIRIALKTITPLFCGGAEQNGPAELRAPSLKGALRYWYRALDAGYRDRAKKDGPTREEHIFGSAGHGVGLFRLVVSGSSSGAWRWHDQRRRYRDAFTINPEQPDVKNGILYLGYSHDLGFGKPDGNDRKAIPADEVITAVMRFPCKPQERERRAIAASWWLFGHVGGLGSRSRRGFGTVALQGWSTLGDAWEEFAQLPIAYSATTPADWLAKFEQGLKTLSGWYRRTRSDDHLVLGPGTRFYLIDDGFQDGELNKQPVRAWECALNRAGRLMQDFRQRHGVTKGGDYDLVKAHLCAEHPRAPGCGGKGTPLVKPPERAAFGLPLAFRFGSLKYSVTGRDGRPRDITPSLTLQGTEHDRNASPIHFRIIQVGSKCYPFFARFDAPLLANGEQVAAIMRPHAPPRAIGPGRTTILDDFCDKILEPAALKPVVTWC